MGEYATWTGFCAGGSVIFGLGLVTWVDELEPFYWGILLTCCCSRPFQNMLARIWWVCGSQRVGEPDLVVLTCSWDMNTDFIKWDEILGMVALGFHQVMSTLGIEGVIAGDLESSRYCTWSISVAPGLQGWVVP